MIQIFFLFALYEMDTLSIYVYFLLVGGKFDFHSDFHKNSLTLTSSAPFRETANLVAIVCVSSLPSLSVL